MTLVFNTKKPLQKDIHKLLDILYSETSQINYSVALYQCLCLLDDYFSCAGKDSSKILETLENYSNIFDNEYIFCMIQIIVSISSGKSE